MFSVDVTLKVTHLYLFSVYSILGLMENQETTRKCYNARDMRHISNGKERKYQEMNGHQKQKEQSRQMIERALFTLMGEKDYAKITVLEIVERADVARRTFYRLYKRKEDVIESYLSRLCDMYQTQYSALEGYDINRISREYFAFWYQYRDLLLLLHGHGLDYMVYDKIGLASEDVVKRRIGDKELAMSIEIDYFVDYTAGGFMNLLCRWIRSGMNETPEEYAAKVSKAIMKFINS